MWKGDGLWQHTVFVVVTHLGGGFVVVKCFGVGGRLDRSLTVQCQSTGVVVVRVVRVVRLGTAGTADGRDRDGVVVVYNDGRGRTEAFAVLAFGNVNGGGQLAVVLVNLGVILGMVFLVVVVMMMVVVVVVVVRAKRRKETHGCQDDLF